MDHRGDGGDHEKPGLPEPVREQMVAAIEQWAGTHPQRDEPLVQFGGSRALSPIEIAAAVEDPEHGPEGRLMLAVLAHALTELPEPERPTVHELVSGFLRSAGVR